MCELPQTIIKARSLLLAPGSTNVEREEKKTDWSSMNQVKNRSEQRERKL